MESRASVADEQLRVFYSRAAALYVSLYGIYVPAKSKGVRELGSNSEMVISHLAAWKESIEAELRYTTDQDEHYLEYSAWYFRGTGEKPQGPVWPNHCPPVREARGVLKILANFHDVSAEFRLGTFGIVIEGLADAVFALKAVIDSQDDGPIDRNRLAKLLDVERQTLKNRADELPKPIKRGPKGVPIYKYSEAKAALEVMFPDRAYKLLGYHEVLEKTN